MKRALLTLALALLCGSCSSISKDIRVDNAQFVKDMGVGWNLGNTLDTRSSDELAWGNPYTTRAMIDMVSEKGFKTLRILVTWHTHMDEEYNIEIAWLDHVEEIVGYGLANDMYVIVNIHHDEEIISPTYASEAESTRAIRSIWRQIAERFKEYDNRLIFETFNEMRVKGSEMEWRGGTEEERDCINRLHIAALDVIRSSGGDNATRKVMLSTYAASATEVAMQALTLPEGDDNLLVSIHSYFPFAFCHSLTEDNWGSDEDKAEMEELFSLIKSSLIDRGYAVVMGEWGSKSNNNNDDLRACHAQHYVSKALEYGIAPLVWDNGSTYELLDRRNLSWKREGIADAIVGATKYNTNQN